MNAAHVFEESRNFKMDEDFEWQPPSEAEKKLLQARRERSDKISKIMGDYLLKGYKMLGSTCDKCDTILLQDRQGKNYCIACQELDSDVEKDNPVMNETAALSQVREGQRSLSGRSPTKVNPGGQTCQPDAGIPAGPMGNTGRSLGSVQQRTVIEMPAVLGIDFGDTVETLCQKINWATDELRRTSNIDYCVQLCHMIKACAEAIQSVRSVC